MKARSRYRAWLLVLRLEYQGDNLLTWFVASALAVSHDHHFHVGWFALGLLMLVLAQAALELLDGYYDYIQGAHKRKTSDAQRWTGGSGVLASGELPGHRVHNTAWVLGIAAFLLFVVITAMRTKLPGLLIGVVGAIAGAGWAMPPLKLSYRGLGEFVLPIVAGPLLAAEAWLVSTGSFDVRALLIGAPFGLLELAMAMAHGIVDRESDAQVGKRTFVVRHGDWLAARIYGWTLISTALLLVALVIGKVVSAWMLMVFVLAPWAYDSGKMVASVARDRRWLASFTRGFAPYWLHVGLGLTGVVATLSTLDRLPRRVLMAAFLFSYAPVAATLIRQQKKRA